MEQVVIIGGGPAGYTAALYAARANLSPVVLTGSTIGGQLSLTSEIENFPGFPESLGGMDLMDRMRQQAERFGAEMKYEEVTSVAFEPGAHRITTDRNEYTAKAVVISTGSSPRLLGVPGEERFFGRGVSTCATCDGAFYRDQKVAVVGGGDSAMEEGLFLTRFASHVWIIHRRHELRASRIMQERALKHPKIAFQWGSVVDEVLGDETTGVTGVRVRELESDRVTGTGRRGPLHRHRAHAQYRSLQGQARSGRAGLHPDGPEAAHQRARRVRGRGRAGPRLPPGGHRGGYGMRRRHGSGKIHR